MRHHIRLMMGLVVSATLAGCLGDHGATAGLAGDPVSSDANAIHVDCAAAVAGDGSALHPLNSLAGANAVELAPAAQLLFRRGSVCTGMLKPKGSGTQGAPVVIGAYGDGALPVIEANGLTTAALQIEDMSQVIVQDLELTNRGNSGSPHRGLYLTAKSARVGDVTARRLYIHDVAGSVTFSDTDKSGGGIILKVLGPLPAKFDNVLIEDNRIEDVARSGIFIFGIQGASSTPRPRASEPWPEASIGIVVRNNALTRLAGDGIVVDATLGALIEGNVLSAGNLAGRNFFDPNVRNCSAGIWAFNANNTLIQNNEVFDMHYGQSATDGCDGTAFDIDYDQDGTIVQFNYSHDNAGGFIMLCSDDQPRTADIRYNLSIDDRHTFSAVPCKAPGAIGGFDGIRFYNNTIVADAPNSSMEIVPLPVLYNAGTFEFRNNILYATQLRNTPLACGARCASNLFFSMAPSGASPVVADPLFEDAALRGQGRLQVGQGFRLRAGSPAIGMGVAISGTPPTDYFGNPVPSGVAPALGFHQAPG